MHDHSVLLSRALGDEGIACSPHWLWRSEDSLRGSRGEFRRWRRQLAAELAAERPDAILLHYSVFSYSYRGLPLFVAPTVSTLRATGVPVLSILHELVYPWRLGGWHGKVWAVSQRALLVAVMRASAAVVVTAPFNADWLASRPWLPSRPVGLAPVFSNLPAPSARASMPAPGAANLVGLFGYAYEGAAASLVLDAIRLLHERGLPVRLQLLGAPGPDSPAAEAWRAGARSRGIEQALSFSGVLPAQELSDALSACDVLLHPEPSGPTSRKGTLAGSLASGTAVVAIDGPRSWPELLDAQGALVVAPTPEGLAEGIAGLLRDEHRRAQQGDRGGEFAREAMGLERSARVVAGLLDDVLARTHG